MEGIFNRFTKDWQKFGLMGLGPFLVQFVAGLVGVVLGIAMVGGSLFTIASMEAVGEIDPGVIITALGSLGGFLIVAMILGLVTMGLAQAGLVGSVVAYRRGEEITLGTFWSYATRYFGRMVVLYLLLTLVMIPTVLILLIIPVIGWLALFLWLPTSAVALGIYPAYLAISEDQSASAAFGNGFRALFSQFGQSLLSGLIMMAIGVVMWAVGMVPLIGALVVAIFGQPLITFFFIERYEAVIRPKLV